MGKWFYVEVFLDIVEDEIYCCNYLLVIDFVMVMFDGYVLFSWECGYGDYVMKLDLIMICFMLWLNKIVMVLCDVLDYYIYKLVFYFLCEMLKVQIVCVEVMGLMFVMVIELEFFLFQGMYDEIVVNGYCDLKMILSYNEDYNIFQIFKEEFVMQLICNYLCEMGVLVEGLKGEVEVGQEELNIKYDLVMVIVDYYILVKYVVKEIVYQNGVVVMFLFKWY